MEENSTTSHAFIPYTYLQTAVVNTSFFDGCKKVVFDDMDYLPWDNPDNIVSADVEAFTYRMTNTMLVLLFLIGGPGNVINMAVFYKQGFKDRVNLCLFALSLADELYLIVSMCHHAEQAFTQFTTKEKYGHMFTFLANNHFTGLIGFSYVSDVLSAIIASERCYCVLRPLKFQSLMRNRTMMAIIILVYVLVLGLYFIAAFRFQIGCVYDPMSGFTEKAVVIGSLYQKHKELVDYLDGFFFGVALPGSVMVLTLTTTTITVIKLRQIVTWRAETSSSLSIREVALTKMLVGTSILFIVCISPFAVTKICWLFFPEMNAGRRNHNFYLTTIGMNALFTYINASFNIFVYYAMGSRFKATLRSLLRRKENQKN